jgi:hypothetical protein
MHERRYSESAAATEQALKLNGNNYLVWSNLMLAYEGAKESEKAEAARRNVLDPRAVLRSIIGEFAQA